MKKAFYSLLILLAFTQLTIAETKVGIILPLTGDAGAVGTSMKDAMELAYSKLSPKLQKEIQLVFEDDGLDPKRTVSAFKKLVYHDKVSVIANAGSTNANAIAPLADKEKIPHIAIATDPAVVRGKKWVVNFWVTAKTEITATVKELKRLKYKNIVRVATVQDAMLALKDEFDRQNDGYFKIVLDEEFTPEFRDFRAFISKIRSEKDVDCILVMMMPGQVGNFARQVREMNIDLPFFGLEAFEDSSEVKASHGALIGQPYINAADPSNEFITEYKTKFPENSFFGVPNAHDLVLLVAAAIEQNPTREGINDFLHHVKNFSGAIGTYSAAGDNTFTLPAALKIVSAD